MAASATDGRNSAADGELEPVRSDYRALAAGPELDGLPPPFFPPGARRSRGAAALQVTRTPRPPAEQLSPEEETAIPEDAFISPDEPLRKFREDAFIYPDEPIRRERPREQPGEEDVVVGWIGDEEYFNAKERGAKAAAPRPVPGWSSLDPESARRTAERLEALAESLRAMGGAALEIPPAADPLDVALRSFLAGYLLSRPSTG